MSLDALNRPKTSSLRFYDIKLTIKAQSHQSMAGMRSCAIHDNCTETLHTCHCNIVTRLDQIWVNFDFLDWSRLPVHVHSFLEEFEGGLLHVGGDVRADNRPIGMRG